MTNRAIVHTASGIGGIHADGFARLRGALALGQLLALVLAQVALPVQLRVVELAAVLGVVILSNVGLVLWRREHASSERLLFALMSLDVLALTLMLYFSGGPMNPLSSLYLVYVAWAAFALKPQATWAMSILAFVSFGALFLWNIPLVFVPGTDHAHGHAWHLQGMWLSLGLAAVLIVYFVQSLKRALLRRDEEVARLEASGVKADRLAALATLSAGAAHELATPLSTIAVVAKELERGLEKEGRAEAAEDARLVRDQVRRCRDILDRMAADSGEVIGEPAVAMSAADLAQSAVGRLTTAQQLRVQVEASAALEVGVFPPKALARGIHGLLTNALQAGGDQQVRFRVSLQEGDVLVEVQDFGAGMSSEILQRIGEPFYTTKETGAGMGLGVFLIRTIAERLGGYLEYKSTLGAGSTAILRLPVAGERRPVA